jgi:hypothetical protein
MNHINPAHCTEALVELMLGGIPVGRIGYPLHCRLRYFDLVSRRHFSAASAVASSVSVFQSRELVGQAFLLAEEFVSGTVPLETCYNSRVRVAPSSLSATIGGHINMPIAHRMRAGPGCRRTCPRSLRLWTPAPSPCSSSTPAQQSSRPWSCKGAVSQRLLTALRCAVVRSEMLASCAACTLARAVSLWCS